jgi:hypothetical protein
MDLSFFICRMGASWQWVHAALGSDGGTNTLQSNLQYPAAPRIKPNPGPVVPPLENTGYNTSKGHTKGSSINFSCERGESTG